MRALRVVTVLSLMSPTLLLGQVRRDAAERASDRRQVATDAAQGLGDMGDVRRMEAIVGELDRSRSAGDKAAESAAQARLAAELGREAREGARDATQDRREVAGSRSEIGSDRREVRRDRASGAPAPQTRADRRDLRDDRRDTRDDVRDAAAAKQRAERQRAIITELRQIQPQVTAGAASATTRQRALLNDFLAISREDAKATGRELGEDRRELREDRRETREDIRRP